MSRFSIIVPVYNLEKYIMRCVESVLNQTFTDFELIIINDGSSDRSKEILEQLKDERIKVINKENGGASSARNAGLEICTGEYITFIDGDDTIDERFLEIINNVIKKTNSKILMMSLLKNTSEHFPIANYTEEYINFNKVQAMEKILYQKKLDAAVIGKIFHKSIWQNEKFLEDCLYEDLEILFDLIDKTDEITYLKYCGYYYTIREDGTTLKKFTENKMQLLDICDDLKEKYVKKYDSLKKAFEYRSLESAFHLFLQAYSLDKKSEDELWRRIKKDRFKILTNRKANIKIKLAVMISMLGREKLYYIFHFISKGNIYRKGKI